ncbi:fungal specific transcription factor, partial [Penicillium cinerascens]
MVVDRTSRAERYLFHLRFLHSRIFLFRPMLSRFYSRKSDPQSTSAKPLSLSDRLLRQCAGMCIEAAQKVTSLIIGSLEPDESIGILPWWIRIYYLHIAGAIFLAAMFETDLFTDSVSRSWHDVLSGLRAHVHLSTYVQQCIYTIMQTACSTLDGGKQLAEETSGCCFDDIFQDIRFDFDNFLFGTEDFVDGL